MNHPQGGRGVLSSTEQVAAVLAGELAYDAADDSAQAVVRSKWDELLDQERTGFDLEAVFRAEGRRSWVSSDEQGRPVVVYADRLDG